MESCDLKGFFPTIASRFAGDGDVDEGTMRPITSYVIENGVHSIMTTEGAGEFPHLLREGRHLVPHIVVEEASCRYYEEIAAISVLPMTVDDNPIYTGNTLTP